MRYEVLNSSSPQFQNIAETIDLDTIWLAGQMNGIVSLLKKRFPYHHQYSSDFKKADRHLVEAVQYLEDNGGFEDEWTGISFSSFSGSRMVRQNFVAFKSQVDMMKYKIATQQDQL